MHYYILIYKTRDEREREKYLKGLIKLIKINIFKNYLLNKRLSDRTDTKDGVARFLCKKGFPNIFKNLE